MFTGRGYGLAAEVFLNVWGWNSPRYNDGFTTFPAASQPQGSSALVYTGPSQSPGSSALVYTGTRTGAGTGAGAGSGSCSYNCVIIPPAPPIDQNPNNGPNPEPAPTRTQPKAELADGTWNVKKGVDATVDPDTMRGLLDDGEYTPADLASLDMLQSLFPDQDIDPDLGFGKSGVDPSAQRTRNRCSRDFPSSAPAFYYAPMTRFGAGPDDCRATGAVAYIDSYDLRAWRLDPKWKPAGYERLPVGNRAALHLIGNQMGGANDTLRNFVAGYQNPANSPHMRSLEDELTSTVKSGQRVALGVLPVYNGTDPAIPTEIKMYAVGDGGYRLNCTVYNRASGGYSCSERSSGGTLSVP
ncbi:DNA/RNA non-specific endonuclease [Streptomyces sp. Act143]|uniref:DNA/RNA non-specific endonuclease n=1 Tax=Streptomyces sp. Act143 TaxID=2200760 RepID=UPI0015E82665|nr:DNA/RNA non-specific endonuclease [Streptomyces sp. Act143]